MTFSRLTQSSSPTHPRFDSPAQLAIVAVVLWVVGAVIHPLVLLVPIGIVLLLAAGAAYLMRPRSQTMYWRRPAHRAQRPPGRRAAVVLHGFPPLNVLAGHRHEPGFETRGDARLEARRVDRVAEQRRGGGYAQVADAARVDQTEVAQVWLEVDGEAVQRHAMALGDADRRDLATVLSRRRRGPRRCARSIPSSASASTMASSSART